MADQGAQLAEELLGRHNLAFTLSNPREPDNPIILASQEFIDMTGYSASDILGRNCRILQVGDEP